MNAVWGIRWDREDGRRRRLLLAGALVAVLAGVALLLISRGPAPVAMHAVIVRAEPGGLAAAQHAVERSGGTVGQALPVVDGFVAHVPAGSERSLGASAGVVAVVGDGRMGGWAENPSEAAAATPGTSLDAVREAIGATQSGATGAGVDVAVVDTGMVPVPALAGAGKVVQGPDFSNQSRDSHLAHLDTFGHGTHLAGIIAGDDKASGFRGVAPGARLVNVKAAGADGSTTLAAIVASVGWVIAHRNDNGLHVRVLNLSFGTPPKRYEGDLLAYAVEQAWKAGIVVVVSAGNEGEKGRGLTSPGYDPFVLSVGADDLAGTAAVGDDVVPTWSSRGAGRNPDLVAPGRSIVSLRDPNSFVDAAFPGGRVNDAAGRFFRGSGTSQATAIVSGLVADLLSKYPNMTPDQVKGVLRSNATPLAGVSTNLQGAGDVSVANLGGLKLSSVPAYTQTFPAADGTGSLEASRGTAHLYKADGTMLTGEMTVFGVPFDGNSWSNNAWDGNSWSGGSWSGNSWSGNSWSGDVWTGNSWSGNSWSGNSWSGNSWSGNSWSGNSWSGTTWASSDWS